MRKWLIFPLITLSFLGLSHIFAADSTSTNQTKTHLITKANIEEAKPSLFGIALGDKEAHVLKKLGQPLRKELSALGYVWYVYKPDKHQYVQIGIKQGQVVDVYSNTPHATIDQITLGTTYPSLAAHYKLESSVTFAHENAQIEITNQLHERPLVIHAGTPIIFYIDKHDEQKIIGLRLIDKEMLIRGSYYETKWTYQGDQPDFGPIAISQKEQELVDLAHARQILDLVNILREQKNLLKVKWDNKVANTAKEHATDMEENQFFDHTSPTTGLTPFERLQNKGVSYQVAGENIAAGYPDAIEAHHSWVNSPTHRKNVLEKEFTHMGVGARKDHFTQNFISAP